MRKRKSVIAHLAGRGPHGLRRLYAAGFSLIELMTVIAIIAIMMLIAAPSFVSFHKNSELTGAINNFSASLAVARAEAMRLNIHTLVTPATGGWANGWTAYADIDNDQAYTSGTDKLLDQQPKLPSDVTITVTTGDLPAAGVSFSGNGYPQATGSSSFIYGNLQMTNGLRSRRLVLQPTGQISVCDPAGTAGNVTACGP